MNFGMIFPDKSSSNVSVRVNKQIFLDHRGVSTTFFLCGGLGVHSKTEVMVINKQSL